MVRMRQNGPKGSFFYVTLPFGPFLMEQDNFNGFLHPTVFEKLKYYFFNRMSGNTKKLTGKNFKIRF
jgi:hypothetical protein